MLTKLLRLTGSNRRRYKEVQTYTGLDARCIHCWLTMLRRKSSKILQLLLLPQSPTCPPSCRRQRVDQRPAPCCKPTPLLPPHSLSRRKHKQKLTSKLRSHQHPPSLVRQSLHLACPPTGASGVSLLTTWCGIAVSLFAAARATGVGTASTAAPCFATAGKHLARAAAQPSRCRRRASPSALCRRRVQLRHCCQSRPRHHRLRNAQTPRRRGPGLHLHPTISLRHAQRSATSPPLSTPTTWSPPPVAAHARPPVTRGPRQATASASAPCSGSRRLGPRPCPWAAARRHHLRLTFTSSHVPPGCFSVCRLAGLEGRVHRLRPSQFASPMPPA